VKLVCPSCGAIHSAEAWKNDADIRRALMVLGELPLSVSSRTMLYLALFRPHSGRGLMWAKACRLLVELNSLVSADRIGWERLPARPNSAVAWSRAMETVVERPPKRLPLTSHGYLRRIAYEIADEMDKDAERAKITDERAGRHRPGDDRREREPERWVTPEEMRAIRVKRTGRKG